MSDTTEGARTTSPEVLDKLKRFEPQYSDRYLEIGGIRLHYTDWSSEKLDVVLMVGGIIQQCHVWDPIASILSKRFRVICLDLRGQGDSDWCRGGYRLKDFVGDIVAFVETLEIEGFTFVGHSLGARIAMAFGGLHPELAANLILSDTGPGVPRSTALAAREEVEWTFRLRGFRDEEQVIAAYEEEHPEWDPLAYLLYARHQYRRNWAGRLILKADPDLYWITSAASLPDIDLLWETVSRIRARTLIAWGRNGNNLSFLDEDMVEKMLSMIPQAELKEFETGHYVPLENFDAFAGTVEEFILGG